MRLAAEKDYTIVKGDRIASVTDDLTDVLGLMWDAAERDSVKLKIMIDMEVEA